MSGKLACLSTPLLLPPLERASSNSSDFRFPRQTALARETTRCFESIPRTSDADLRTCRVICTCLIPPTSMGSSLHPQPLRRYSPRDMACIISNTQRSVGGLRRPFLIPSQDVAPSHIAVLDKSKCPVQIRKSKEYQPHFSVPSIF